MRKILTVLILPLICLYGCSDSPEVSGTAPPSPAQDSDGANPGAAPVTGYPHKVLWGDTHLHTNLSQDAFTFGVTLGPEEAYRFARGEEVIATYGVTAKLDRPLDFLVVADHAEGLGAMEMLMEGDQRLMADPRLREWKALIEQGDAASRLEVARDGRDNGWPDALEDAGVKRTAWDRQVTVADQFNDPGNFTALIGYEWTSWPGGDNLHRVIIFRDAAERAGKILPFSANDSDDPEDLWRFLANYEESTGGRALAIPHNGNLSNGTMFARVDREGNPIDPEYAKTRARWEPVVEVTQIKGDGETHPFLSPDDEFADFATWDFGNFQGVPKTDDMLEYEYARQALARGLALERQLGVNPYQFGMIGSTDSHTAIASAEEDNFFGKHSAGLEPSAERWDNPVGAAGEVTVMGWQMAAAGYAAVWARDNTRAEIFDALKRREVYATTGPRMVLRFFGGWSFDGKDAERPEIAAVGYGKGVPMGGVLPPRQTDGAPRFLISVMKDPDGANLDRVQVVKGWLGTDGDTRERVYDVVWSDAATRKVNADGRLAPVGNTVDLETATFENSIGDPALTTVWTDPDFDASKPAFYYVRVLQIPTPRWTLYDAVRYGIDLPPDIPVMLQERAYTSPIWYRPTAAGSMAAAE